MKNKSVKNVPMTLNFTYSSGVSVYVGMPARIKENNGDVIWTGEVSRIETLSNGTTEVTLMPTSVITEVTFMSDSVDREGRNE